MISKFPTLKFTFLSGLALVALTGCEIQYGLNEGTELVTGADSQDGQGTTGGEDIPDSVATGSLQGRVCAPNGAGWIVGATVYIDTEWGRLETTSDENGWFVLEGVPEGDYTVHFIKGSFESSMDVRIIADERLALSEEECLENDVTIAVVTGEYDHIQTILDRLSLDYDLYGGTYGMDGSAANEHVQLMSNPSELAKYDILFFNCGMTEDWMWSGSNVGQNLRDYVNGGGSIYASDMAYYVLEETFPSAVSFVGNDSTPGAAYVGEMGYVQGDVVDETMKAVLGKDVAEINYDLPSWAAIESAQPGTPLIRGSYQYYDMNSMDYSVMTQTGPLAVRYESGAGVFLYTSFHNEAQATQDMDAILREFVLSL